MPKPKPRKKGPLSNTEEHEERKESMRKTMDTMKVHLDHATLHNKKACKYVVKELGLLVRQLKEQVDEDYTYPAPYLTGNFGSSEDDTRYDDDEPLESTEQDKLQKKKELPFKFVLRHPANIKDMKENEPIEAEIVGTIPKKWKYEKPLTDFYTAWKAKIEASMAADDGRPKNMRELSEKLRKTKDGKEMNLKAIYHDFDETNPYDVNLSLPSYLPATKQQPTTLDSTEEPQPQSRKSSESSDDFELVNQD
ncbi:hypothetical protein CAEBREN_16424 [Caenorhabditis brenneri]|uniref:Uncharacterized protein n=1 Tax=Caenorhabditis brenneri TaxID=135651 RepID=G0NPE1_CAEBE|nr:hypothetical protein CAEBREN_16424 [Caenorhabditis brenneri]